MIYSSPLKPLLVALNSAITSLGYIPVDTDVFPRVVVDQLEMRDTNVTKDSVAWEFTFILDIITKEVSQLPSIEILEKVRRAINKETIQLQDYTVQTLEPESLTTLSEPEDSIWRQIQRYRVLITKNK